MITICNICGKTPCDYRCPNYEEPNTTYYCSICGHGIHDGEEYIENHNGDMAHLDCLDTVKETLDWLGEDVSTMDLYGED